MPPGRLLALAKTPLGLERIAASRIAEEAGYEAVPFPGGFPGLVEVFGDDEPGKAADRILETVEEVESVVAALCVCDSGELGKLAACVVDCVRKELAKASSFAVRCVRRGSQSYKSTDVNRIVGSMIVSELGLKVDLESPELAVLVEIVGDHAVVGVSRGLPGYRKKSPLKREVYEYFWKLSVAQIPYTGDRTAVRVMGEKIGRGLQTFEVGEYVVAPIKPISAYMLVDFVQGLRRGIAARLDVQRKSYSRPVRETKVMVQDLYQLFRDRRGEQLVVFEPEGDPIDRVGRRLALGLIKEDRVTWVFGSREGVPSGLYRFASLVVDLAPGITISTEFAVTSALTAVLPFLEEELRSGEADSNLSLRV